MILVERIIIKNMYKKIIQVSVLVLITILFSACQLRKNSEIDDSSLDELTIKDENNLFEDSFSEEINTFDVVDCGEWIGTDFESADCFFTALNNNCAKAKIKSSILNYDYAIDNLLNPDSEKKYSYISSDLVDNQCYINIIENNGSIKCIYNKELLEEKLKEDIQYLSNNMDDDHDYDFNNSDFKLRTLYDLIVIESRQDYDNCYWNINENVSSDDNWQILSDKNTNHDISFSNNHLYILRSLGMREKNDYFIIDKYKDGIIVESIETPKFNLVHENSWPKIFVDSFDNIFIYNLNTLIDLNTEDKLFLDLTRVSRNSNLIYYNKTQDNWQIFEDKNGSFGNINAINLNHLGVWMALSGGRLYLYDYNIWEEHTPWKLGVDELRAYANVSANNDYLILFSNGHAVEVYNNGKFTTSFLARSSGFYDFNYSDINNDNEIYFLGIDNKLNIFNLETKNIQKIELLNNNISDCLYFKDTGTWCYGFDDQSNFIIYNYINEEWNEYQFLNLENLSPIKIIAISSKLYVLSSSGALYDFNIDL
jgi:hypothetical protein